MTYLLSLVAMVTNVQCIVITEHQLIMTGPMTSPPRLTPQTTPSWSSTMPHQPLALCARGRHTPWSGLGRGRPGSAVRSAVRSGEWSAVTHWPQWTPSTLWCMTDRGRTDQHTPVWWLAAHSHLIGLTSVCIQQHSLRAYFCIWPI